MQKASPMRGAEWAAVNVIFTEAFRHDQRVWRRVDLRQGVIDFGAILAEDTYSSSERLLLRAAASFWCRGGFEISLGSAAYTLGDPTLGILLKALAAARSSRLPV